MHRWRYKCIQVINTLVLIGWLVVSAAAAAGNGIVRVAASQMMSEQQFCHGLKLVCCAVYLKQLSANLRGNINVLLVTCIHIWCHTL